MIIKLIDVEITPKLEKLLHENLENVATSIEISINNKNYISLIFNLKNGKTEDIGFSKMEELETGLIHLKKYGNKYYLYDILSLYMKTYIT